MSGDEGSAVRAVGIAPVGMSPEPGRRLASRAPAGSKLALAVLVALVVLSPWPFGSVLLRTTQAIALVSLATALGAFAWDGGAARCGSPPRRSCGRSLGLWLLAVFQLVPLPAALHRWLAPGSAAVWHPDVPRRGRRPRPRPAPDLAPPRGHAPLARVRDGPRRARAGRGARAARAPLLLRASIAIVAGGVLGRGLRPRRAARLRRQALRRLERAHRRPLRPLRQQEPLRRLRRARGAPRGGPRDGPRRRGPPRPRLAELDREPPREVGRRSPGARPSCSCWRCRSRSRAAASSA